MVGDEEKHVDRLESQLDGAQPPWRTRKMQAAARPDMTDTRQPSSVLGQSVLVPLAILMETRFALTKRG